jgi:predicted RNA-binding Zn-ribbon protein involved in translation (DUF1610 family)
MALSMRVARIERRRGGGAPPDFSCPDCGGGNDDERWRATVEWLTLHEEPDPLECCPRCGEAIEIVVWED